MSLDSSSRDESLDCIDLDISGPVLAYQSVPLKRTVESHNVDSVCASSKRQRLAPTYQTDTSDESEDDLQVTSTDSQETPNLNHKPNQAAFVRIPAPAFPTSAFQGDEPPRCCSEDHAVSELSVIYPPLSSDDDEDEYVAFVLDDFEIYRPGRGGAERRALTLASLNELLTVAADDLYCFDGCLRYGSESRYVQGVRFESLAIEGYGSESFNIDSICIQSLRYAGSKFWYQLGRPSQRYQPYHEPFMWLALFTKHFEEYLSAKHNTCLADFESRFYVFLTSKHGMDPHFRRWHSQYNNRNPKDFRQVVATNVEWLWKETTNLSEGARYHILWKEVDPKQLGAIAEERLSISKTVVTPLVHQLFSRMYFQEYLKVAPIDGGVLESVQERAQSLGLSVMPQSSQEASEQHWKVVEDPEDVHVGDVVVLDRDVDGVWQDESQVWYAYVQDIRQDRWGALFMLIWLYRASETILDEAFYPHGAELFMSDHCNCEDNRVRFEDIRAILPTEIGAKQPQTTAAAFVRLTYITPDEESGKDAAFVTLKKEHLTCSHRTQRQEEVFSHGATVLVSIRGQSFLQPAGYVSRCSDGQHVVRRFIRRARYDTEARPNELLEAIDSTEPLHVPSHAIKRQCYVRRFNVQQVRQGRDVVPYSYDGAADCWCVTGAIRFGSDNGFRVTPVDWSRPAGFIEGFDPAQPSQGRLSGLSLFSGGGSFDRGLEEGQAIDTKWAVEIESLPIHTYKANVRNSDCQLWRGSANDYLAKAFAGCGLAKVARVGDVHFISGGSPCKGFSIATHDKNSMKSLGYASLIACLLAYINFYQPMYAVLENVFAMCASLGKQKSENVFSQVIACLISMGYQTQTFVSDAWAHGSSQTRTRLFVTIAAPGLKPAQAPAQTHLHPPKTMAVAIGKTKSGVKYGMRRSGPCPFEHTSAAESTKDLPLIDKGLVRTQIAYPEHRTKSRETFTRALIPEFIPRFPHRSDWIYAARKRLMPEQLLNTFAARSEEWWCQASKAFRRIDPNRLMPTIRTANDLSDYRMGDCLHWSEPRAITVMEARRAQSIPDHEVLIGSPAQQWLVIGNGVDRKASVAMGVNFREAWLSSQSQELVGAIKPFTTRIDRDMATVDVRHNASDLQNSDKDSTAEKHSQLGNKHTHRDRGRFARHIAHPLPGSGRKRNRRNSRGQFLPDITHPLPEAGSMIESRELYDKSQNNNKGYENVNGPSDSDSLPASSQDVQVAVESRTTSPSVSDPDHLDFEDDMAPFADESPLLTSVERDDPQVGIKQVARTSHR
ncbi:MAG: hypothetical protein Q9159_006041 [Coniocarpon cinnabarinum]